MQKYLSQLGNFIQIHCGKIVFVGLVALFMSCLGLKTYQIESDINKLWIDGEPLIRQSLSCVGKPHSAIILFPTFSESCH